MRKPALLLGALLLALPFAAPAFARSAGEQPEGLEGVEISPKLGTMVPLDVAFVDDTGAAVRLGDWFGGEKPVVLTLGYYRCPMLCDLVLNGLVQALREQDWEPGEDYEIVTLTIDPEETPELAAAKKKNYVEDFGRSSANAGWHFLTGPQESISAVADAVGFRYRYDEKTGEYAHGAAVFLLSPEGKLTQVLRGILFEGRTIRLALAEASEGKLGTTVDTLLLWCFQYDESAGRYTIQAWAVMRVAGAVVVLALAAFLLPAWLRRRGRREPEAGGETKA